jgi:hypothetical protein
MPKIYWNTKIERIGRAEAVRVANMALRWCRTNMGINKRKRWQPTWSICKNVEDENLGYYCPYDNEILIHWNRCRTVGELIETCIHEWTHQLQPILTRYDWRLPHHKNPFEQEAFRNELLYGPTCWLDINQKVNNERSNSKTKGV